MAENSTYVIVETGGKQYRVHKGASLVVERIADAEGAKVSLRPTMYFGDGNLIANGSDLEKVKVEAVVKEHLRGEKIRVFTYKAKKGERKRKGHRQELTKLEVTNVSLLSRKPAAPKAEAKPAAEAKTEAKPKAPAKKPATKPSTAKKPAAKTAAAKKPAAKKPTARKPAAKKPAAKKPASKKETS